MNVPRSHVPIFLAMKWSVASRSAFYRGREHFWIVFSFNIRESNNRIYLLKYLPNIHFEFFSEYKLMYTESCEWNSIKMNTGFSFEIPGSARVLLPILTALLIKCAPYWWFGCLLVVSKMYVEYVLRSLNIYLCWLWIYVCLSYISYLFNI